MEDENRMTNIVEMVLMQKLEGELTKKFPIFSGNVYEWRYAKKVTKYDKNFNPWNKDTIIEMLY